MKKKAWTFAAVAICAASTGLNVSADDSCADDVECLKALFKYSQLAERPADRMKDTPECTGVGGAFDQPNALRTPDADVRRMIITEINERLEGNELGATSQWSPKENEANTMYVGCPVESGALGTVLRLFEGVRGLLVQTDAAVKSPDDTGWVPLQPTMGADGTITFPGTDPSDWDQIVSNFQGEGCVFDATRVAVDVLCAAYNLEGPHLELGNMESNPATLTGHSLGGAAVQYVTIRAAEVPKSSHEWECASVQGYAFGSIGLTDSASAGNDGTALETYVSQCDWLTDAVARDNRQTGQITVRSNSRSHFIDAIQDDICECIQGTGECRAYVASTGQRPPTNKSICRLPEVNPEQP